MCLTSIPFAVLGDTDERKQAIMRETNNGSDTANVARSNGPARRGNKKGSHVTQARAKAQRAKLDAQVKAHHGQEEREMSTRHTRLKKTTRQDLQAKRRVIAILIEAYIQDHIGGNSSQKTLEWHQTVLGLMRLFFEEELDIIQIDDVEADDISAWFAHMRSTPAAHGNVRSERTIQTYARSARAFFHWLVRRQTIERNPFERVVFPNRGGNTFVQTQMVK